MADWNDNTFMWIGGIGTAAVAVPVAIALAPPVIAGLGVIGGAVALTALGAGVISTTMAIGKHIDEAIEANNSHETIKKILDKTEDDYTDDKKIEDIERIVKAKTNNIFLKLFYHQSSQEIGDLYLGALEEKVPNSAEEKYEDEKIIAGLKVVNKLDKLRLENNKEFLTALEGFRTTKELASTYIVGQKITENSDSIYNNNNLFEYFITLKKANLALAPRPDGGAPAPAPAADPVLGRAPAPATVLAPAAGAGAGADAGWSP